VVVKNIRLKQMAASPLLLLRRLMVALVCALLAVPMLAQGVARAGVPFLTTPTQALTTGEIERLTLNNPADVWSGGTMVVGGQNVILPRNLLIDLPANRLTLQQVFAQAPASCVARGESGLGKVDLCNTDGKGGIATLSANRSANGNVIVGDLFLQKGAEILTGVVTFMDSTQGYYRVNGIQGSATTGVMVRMNDPAGRQSVQNGLACVAGAINCSADPRFQGDPDNYTNASTTGYPVCIPSTVPRTFVDAHGIVGPAGARVTAAGAPDGSGDVLCPTVNRPAVAVDPVAGDSRRMAPIQVGDHLTVQGNWETINGTRFLSAWNTLLSVALVTSTAAGQPDYMLPLANEIDGPAYNPLAVGRIRAVFEGTATSAAGPDVLAWSTHHDPGTNAFHLLPLASSAGCNAVGRAACLPRPHTWHIQYHNLFVGATQTQFSTCAQISAEPRFRQATTATGITGVTPTAAPGQPCPSAIPGVAAGSAADALGVLAPITHETQWLTGAKFADGQRPNPTLFTIDINGNNAQNGQYLFPMGINLGGLTVPVPLGGALVNANHLGFSFDGIPWDLDRRLSPGGCIGPCEATPQPLDPFPDPGLDPRTQAIGMPNGVYNDPTFSAAPLTFASNRILSFIDPGTGNFNGDRSLLAWPPTAPAAIPITPTPAMNSVKPNITGLTPVAGRVGSPVLIDGTGLAGARQVTFGGVPATSFRNVGPTQVSAVVPVGAQSGPVGVTTLFGTLPTTTFSPVRFAMVSAPAVTGFTPASGPVGTGVTITGSGFNSATNVAFNGTQAVFSVLSDTSIRVAVPTGATSGLITVTNPGGIGVRPIPFTVAASAPSIASFAPATGPVGTTVTLTGSGFTGATNVALNGATATFTVVSDTSITAKVPAGATTGTIAVTTPAGSGTSPTAFTVTAPAAVTLASFSPASAGVGSTVTLTGTGFTGLTSVAFNGITATVVSSTSDTSATATVPAGPSTGPITVSTAGATATSATPFTVIPTPSVTSFTPVSGLAGTVVTITGTDFTGATSVTFNVTSAIFTVGSGTSITATVPVGATTGAIKVTTPSGTATSATNYTVA
jgi:hypothetical protein